MYGFQSLDAVFAKMKDPVKLTAYVTPKTLPADFQGMPALIEKVAKDIESQAGGKFTYETVNLDGANGATLKQSLYDTYGLRPFAASLLSQDTYYMHVLLEIGGETQALYPDPSMAEGDIRTEIEAALRRAAPGFLKTVGVWTPSEEPIAGSVRGAEQPGLYLEHGAPAVGAELHGDARRSVHRPRAGRGRRPAVDRSARVHRSRAFRRRPVPDARRLRDRGDQQLHAGAATDWARAS